LAVVQSLAGFIEDNKLRQQFLAAEAVHELHN
jgi:hypothetical protein